MNPAETHLLQLNEWNLLLHTLGYNGHLILFFDEIAPDIGKLVNNFAARCPFAKVYILDRENIAGRMVFLHVDAIQFFLTMVNHSPISKSATFVSPILSSEEILEFKCFSPNGVR